MNLRTGGQTQQLRSMNINAYATQPGSRQTPRLQNTQKTGLGNGNAGAGWAFGAPSSAGGFGGLGAAPGLGQARPGQLSGFAQVMGGGGGQGPIDMSDFPTLSGGRPQASSAAAGGWNSNVIRQPSTQPQQAVQPPPPQPPHAASSDLSQQSADQFENQHTQQQTSDRGGGGDDFPPLGGQINGDTLRQGAAFGGSLASPDDTLSQTNGQQSQLPIRETSGSFQANQQALTQTTAPSQTSSVQGAPQSQPGPSFGVKRWADMTEDERWGMAGLMAQIEARRQIENGGQVDDTLPPSMRNAALFMGQDLNSLGLDLDSPDPLYPTFAPFPDMNGSSSMFDSRNRQPVPAFALPPAYTVNNVPPVESRMSAFSDETLFNIFYQNPRDIQQEMAAAELSARDWRWHKVLRQWLQKDTREANSSLSLPVIDLTNGTTPIGAPPVRISERTERGVYVFFDANNWRRERREFVLDYDQLDHRTVNAAALAAAAAAAAATTTNGVGSGPGASIGSAVGIPASAATAGPPGAFSANPAMSAAMTGSGAVGGQQTGNSGPAERQNSVISGGA